MKSRYIIFVGLLSAVFILTDCSKDAQQPEILPKISGVSPDSGSYDMITTISGTNFGTTTADNVVKFNGVVAQIVSVFTPGAVSSSPDQIRVLVPQGAGTGPVTVEAKNKTAVGPTFNYIVPVATDYFIRFKANSILQELHTGDAGYYSNTTAANMFINSTTGNGEYIGLEVDWTSKVTPQMILDLKGKTLPMRTNAGSPYVGFFYLPSTNSWTFDSGVLNNLNSAVTITEVVYHSSYRGANAYNVSGTFSGVVSDRDVSTIIVTEGEFLIRLTSSTGM